MMPASTKKYFHYLVIAGLYLVQGLPAGLLVYTLPTLLREQQLSNQTISLLSYLAFPWAIKILWSQFLDQPQYKSYFFMFSFVFSCSIWLVLACYPLNYWLDQGFYYFLLLLLAANFMMASQDVLTDGLTVRIVNETGKGYANSLQVMAYKLGMLLAGAALLAYYDTIGWQLGMLFLCLIVALAYLPLFIFLFYRSKNRSVFHHQSSAKNVRELEHAEPQKSLFSIVLSFCRQPDVKLWLLILLLYKLSDAFISVLLRPFFIDYGLKKIQIAQLSSFGIVVGVVAAALAGYIWKQYSKRGFSLYLLLLVFAIAQSLSVFLYFLVSQSNDWVLLLWCATIFEQIIDVMNTVFLFATMMHFSRALSAGVDYTFQSTLLLSITGSLHLLGAYVADQLGYSYAFFIAFILSFPICIVLGYQVMKTRLNELRINKKTA